VLNFVFKTTAAFRSYQINTDAEVIILYPATSASPGSYSVSCQPGCLRLQACTEAWAGALSPLLALDGPPCLQNPVSVPATGDVSITFTVYRPQAR
jgi:hypothetical protein